MEENCFGFKLPDLLVPGLLVVFCGTAASSESAKRGEYYAGHGNKFWITLCRVGLTDQVLRPNEYQKLFCYSIGLTDLAKRASGADSSIRPNEFDVANFAAKIKKHKPKVICFNGKKAAKIYYHNHQIEFGKQIEKIEGSTVFVLPSTSGAANGFWDIAYWQEVADLIRNCNVK
jgi:double-stranded uracil-DNA glycosylase